VACSIKLIATFGLGIQFRRKGNDGLWRACTVIAHWFPLQLGERKAIPGKKGEPRSARGAITVAR